MRRNRGSHRRGHVVNQDAGLVGISWEDTVGRIICETRTRRWTNKLPVEPRRPPAVPTPTRHSFRFNASLSSREGYIGGPSRTRTCDLLVRRRSKGGNEGQRETAAPDFISVPANTRQPKTTTSRYRLSVICQSTFASLRRAADALPSSPNATARLETRAAMFSFAAHRHPPNAPAQEGRFGSWFHEDAR